jgi:fatty acid desaturase
MGVRVRWAFCFRERARLHLNLLALGLEPCEGLLVHALAAGHDAVHNRAYSNPSVNNFLPCAIIFGSFWLDNTY